MTTDSQGFTPPQLELRPLRLDLPPLRLLPDEDIPTTVTVAAEPAAEAPISAVLAPPTPAEPVTPDVPAPAPAPASTWSAAAPSAPPVIVVEAAVEIGAETGIRIVPVALLVLSVVLCVLAARIALSGALLAVGALLLVDVAGAMRIAGRHRATIAFTASAALLGLWSGWKFAHQFSDMAFVAGLMVVVALIPALLMQLLGWVLARHSTAPADIALRQGTLVRVGAQLATVVSGVVAFNSFSARPDALVTLPILALAAWRFHTARRGVPATT